MSGIWQQRAAQGGTKYCPTQTTSNSRENINMITNLTILVLATIFYSIRDTVCMLWHHWTKTIMPWMW